MDKQAISNVIASLATLTLIGDILLVVLFVLAIVYFGKIKIPFLKPVFAALQTNNLLFSFIVANIATIGSLFFSEIAHFNPCKLCWYQRIFMYPQMLLLLLALIKNDEGIRKYLLLLSSIGLLIALYHSSLQLLPAGMLPCSDELVSCARRNFLYYGYIAIPMMSATAFALIIFFNLFAKGKK